MQPPPRHGRWLVPTAAATTLTLLVLMLGALRSRTAAAAPLNVPPIDPADIDEFGAPGFAAPQYSQGAPSMPPNPTTAPQPPPRIGFYELCMVQLVAWFLLTYVWGKAENRRIKDAWLAEFLPLLRAQFAYVGPGRVGGELDAPSTTNDADPFFQESPDTFALWASGRRHIRGGMSVRLQLRPRHDGIRKMWEFLLPAEDTLTMEASLDPTTTPPLILALARRLHHRSLHLTTPDLFRYTALQPDGSISGGLDPQHFVVYTDVPSGARQLLSAPNAPWVEVVTKHRASFQLFHITDQHASPMPGHSGVPRAALRVKLTLPPLLGRRGRERSMAELRPLVEMVFELLDHLCNPQQFRLNAEATTESRAVRKEIEAREARLLEALRREEAERWRVEREREMSEKLTPEQRRKKEQKQERKDKKKAAAGMLMAGVRR